MYLFKPTNNMLYKEYTTLEDGQVIKFSVSFNKSSHNWATSQAIDKGYRVSVLPVKITKHETYTIEETGAFTGFNDTLLKVDRQSSKRLDQAIEILQERKEKYLEAIKGYL